MLLKNKTAVVTGAAGAIGRAIAARLAEEGARVAWCDADMEKVQCLAAAHGQQGWALDVTDEQQVIQTLDGIGTALGPVDLLVNCAGFLRRSPLLETTLENWERTFAVNARGTFLMTREAGRRMCAAGGGSIVNIASGSGKKPCLEEAAYGASKLAVVALTQVAALELGPSGVRCNVICPGAVAAGMAARDFLNTPEAIESYRQSTALRRVGQPCDIADGVVYLSSDLARHVTGAVLVISGGEYFSL